MKKIKEAVEQLQKGLKKDNELYETYKSNIAMSIYDEFKKANLAISHKSLILLSNKSADRFLKLFIEN